MDLVSYLRVSSESQVDGYGLPVQRRAVQAWAKKHGHKIVAEFVDAGVSGTRDAADRPGLSAALDMLRPPPKARGLVTARLDRLARRLDIQETILAVAWRSGASVFTVDGDEVKPDDPMRRFVRQVMGGVAELERSLVEKRMRDGRRQKADEGKHAVGAHPFGKQSGGRGADSIPDPAEQATVDRIMSLRSAGTSYRGICAALEAEGLPPRRAARWDPATVRRIAERAPAS